MRLVGTSSVQIRVRPTLGYSVYYRASPEPNLQL